MVTKFLILAPFLKILLIIIFVEVLFAWLMNPASHLVFTQVQIVDDLTQLPWMHRDF